MLNVFIDVGFNVRLAIFKNGNLVLSQTYSRDCELMHNLLLRLTGVEIDLLVCMMPGFYNVNQMTEDTYKAFDVVLKGEQFTCSVSKQDLDFFEVLQSHLCVNRIKYVERTSYTITVAQNNTIYYEQYEDFIQCCILHNGIYSFEYLTSGTDEALSEMEDKYTGLKSVNSSVLSNSKLLLYVKNKEFFHLDSSNDLQNFMCLCMFALSNHAKSFSFSYEKSRTSETSVENSEYSDNSNVPPIKEDTPLVIDENKTEPSKEKEVYNLNKTRHFNSKGVFLKIAFFLCLFLNMSIIGFSVFCQRDVIALTKQSSTLRTEQNELQCKIQMLADAEGKKVSETSLKEVYKILKKEQSYIIGEISVNWENEVTLLIYVETLEDNLKIQQQFSKKFEKVEYCSEGTIFVDKTLWYKTSFVLK